MDSQQSTLRNMDSHSFHLPQVAERTRAAASTAASPSKPFKSMAPDGESTLGMAYRMCCRCATSTRVPLEARWEMDPIRKWYHYQVFPRCTLLLHVALIATVTAQIVLVNDTTSQFSQNLHNSWVSWLLPSQISEWAGNPLTYPSDEYFMYREDQLTTSLQALFEGYFSLDTPGTTVPDIIDAYSGEAADEGLAPPLITFTSTMSSGDLADACQLWGVATNGGGGSGSGERHGTQCQGECSACWQQYKYSC